MSEQRREEAAVVSNSRRTGSGWTLAASTYVFAVVMIGVTLPTPLYPRYQAEFGFGSTQTTLLFSVYAVAVIVSLIFFGRLSEAWGRKPLLTAGVLLSVVSALLFMYGSHLGLLYTGRVMSGVAAGIFTATGTVAVLENAPEGRRRLATSLATAANIGGLGLGNLMSGAVAAALPRPLFTPFLIHVILLGLAGAALLGVRESVTTRSHSLAMQLPAIPPESRVVFIRAAPGAVSSFAIAGLYSAVAPSFMHQALGIQSSAVIGAVVFALFGASAACQLLFQSLADRTLVLCGGLIQIASMGSLAAALLTDSTVLLVVSALFGGAGQGFLFATGMRAITDVTEVRNRTAVTTSYFILAYLAMSAPIIGVGVLAVLNGLVASTVTFAVLATVVSCLSLLGLGRWSSKRRGVDGQ